MFGSLRKCSLYTVECLGPWESGIYTEVDTKAGFIVTEMLSIIFRDNIYWIQTQKDIWNNQSCEMHSISRNFKWNP